MKELKDKKVVVEELTKEESTKIFGGAEKKVVAQIKWIVRDGKIVSVTV